MNEKHYNGGENDSPLHFLISIAIITLNEQENLSRTLESLSGFADEIIIVDSGSTDSTHEIARKAGCKVFIEEWKGYATQKNSAFEKCTGEWALFLDADEVPEKSLLDEIKNEIRNSKADSYYIRRKSFYLGKLLNHSWQPDYVLRLARRSKNPEWRGGSVHEYLKVEGKAGYLNGVLIHYSYKDVSEHFRKTIEYAKLSSDDYFKTGKKFSILNLIFNPVAAFIRLYIINRGFLDGIRGLIAASSSFVYTFLKYAFLFEKTDGFQKKYRYNDK